MAVSGMKFPPFWDVDVDVWILQVEAFFSINRITDDEEKYNYLIVNANHRMLLFITDLIKNPPGHNKYRTVRNRILEVFAKTEEAKIEDFIKETKSCNVVKKPSQLLKAMQSYNDNKHFNEKELKLKFLAHLSNAPNIVNVDDVDLEQLGIQCDKQRLCHIRSAYQGYLAEEYMYIDVRRILDRINQMV